jgi:hypothetical protein
LTAVDLATAPPYHLFRLDPEVKEGEQERWTAVELPAYEEVEAERRT